MGFFQDLFGGAAEKEAADRNRAAYTQYGQTGNQALDNGLATSNQWLLNAKDEYAPLAALASKYGGATDMRLNAMGLNGAAGSDAATAAFRASPGYDFTLNQGLDAISRRRAATGMNNSGNADIDTLKFGTGLADQEWTNWMSGLSDLDKQGLATTGTVAAGKSGIDATLANLFQNDATNRIGLQGNVTSGMASANNQEAAGRTAGAKNLLSAGMGLASLAMGGMGGSFGLSGLGNMAQNGLNYVKGDLPNWGTSNFIGPR